MKTERKSFLRFSEETTILTKWSLIIAFFLLYQVTDVKTQFDSICKYDNETIDCQELQDAIKKKVNELSCAREYWKVRITVKKESKRKRSPCVAANVQFSVECATGHDILDKKITEEICSLESRKTIAAISNFKRNIYRFTNDTSEQCLTAHKNTTSCLKISPMHKAKIAGLSLLSPGKRKVTAALKQKEISYDSFFLDSTSKIMLITLSNEYGYSVNQSVEFFISETEEDSVLKTLPASVRLLRLDKKCMYVDTATYTWTDDSCVTIFTNDTTAECKCEHNSAFAAVFAMRNITIPEPISTASTVFEIFSIILLLLTAILLGIYRQKLGDYDRTLVQICLCVALLLEHLFFVISPAGVKIEGLCIAFAALIHYFLVATAVLMVMEGTLMLAKILAPQAFTEGKSTKMRRFLGFGIAWIIPLIYVAICAALGIKNNIYLKGFKQRGQYEYCSINPEYNYVVIVPIGIALCINIVVAIRLGVLVWHMSKQAEQYKPSNLRDRSEATHGRKALRAVAILLPILGIPWTLGFLVNIEYMELFFMSLHILINGLQGFFLFLHYAALNGKVRKAVKRTYMTSVANASATPSIHFTSKKHDSASAL